MLYQCIHCDEKFELGGEAEQRCPKCLRMHGLRAQAAPAAKAAARGRRPALRWAGVAALALLVGLGLYWQRGRAGGALAGAGEPLGERALARELEQRGVQAGELVALLAAGDAIEDFAERAAGSQSSAAGKAQAVVAALRARATAQAFVPWLLSEPRQQAPRTAAGVLAVLSKDGARAQLYPLEVAALAVAALRAIDVPAAIAEVHAVEGERAPLDPSGRFGYFVAALPAQPGHAPQLFDAYGGRTALRPKSHALLSDVEAVGAALSLHASGRLARNEDPAAALRDVDAAVKLLPTSPSVRSARATVLLASGATEPGAAELQAAAQMSLDPARRNNLAMLSLARGDAERAIREVSQALTEHPDFALARVTLAAVHLASGERAQARAELERAEALAPGLASLRLTWAQYHASAGEIEQAIHHATRAVEANPKDPQARLLLAGLYRQASRYDDMRAQARTVLSLVPAPLAPRMRELIGRLLGPTALEVDAPEPAEAAAADPAAALPEPGRLELGSQDPSSASRLRLLDRGDPSTGALKGADGAPTLRLKEPGTGLAPPRP